VTGKEGRAKGKRKSVKGKGRGSIMERAEGREGRKKGEWRCALMILNPGCTITMIHQQ